ncbi:MAG: NYN domain-containing protein [Armatimonadota bacterium]|nr:NYN domain-containing protein [Armatimonadota bacterium]MCX7777111.1 NYN domain-containing protein [Armatimonadota bacterium]MDW8025158.1 NYN domain-containing protein [Armatimonadota bacterium]
MREELQGASSSHFRDDFDSDIAQGDLFPPQRDHTWSITKDEFAPRPHEQPWKVGVFIDVQNLYLCIKSVFNQAKINYRALKEFLSRNGAIVKMTAFTCYDPDNRSQLDFIHALAIMGYRVVAKPLKRLPDGSVKASMDMEMAIEILSEAPHLDEIVIVTGDGDFAPLIDQLARMGKVVKVIGPDKLTSPELIRSCDAFINLTQIDGILDI